MSRRRRRLLGVVTLLLLGVAGIGVLARSGAPRTAEGTTVGGVPVGNLTGTGVETALRRELERRPGALTFVLGERRLTVPVGDIGLSLDVRASARAALDRSGTGRWPFLGPSKGRAVAPVLTPEDSVLGPLEQRLVTAADIPESDGQLLFQGGELTALPPADGQAADPEEVHRALLRSLSQLPWPAEVALPVTAQPAHTSPATVDQLLALGRSHLDRTSSLTAGGRTFALRSALGSQLALRPVGEGAGHGLELGLGAHAREVIAVPAATALSASASEPKVAAPAAVALLREQGNASWRPRPTRTSLVAGGKPGVQVTADAVLATLAKALRAPTATGPLAVTAVLQPPKSSDEGARKINSVLGTFTTPFACCQPRVRNIRVIARTVDGTLIAPGESFSLNDIAGKRTKAKGYVEAPFILDGELSKDVGGGVSQMATTTFNAAFFAGMRLNRHQPHSFYISRYPAGREATVNYPGIDLKWTNTSDSPVLVRAATTERSLTVTLYGRDDGRVVSGVSGTRMPVPGKDFRITVTRTVVVPGQEPASQRFVTTYNKPPEGE